MDLWKELRAWGRRARCKVLASGNILQRKRSEGVVLLSATEETWGLTPPSKRGRIPHQWPSIRREFKRKRPQRQHIPAHLRSAGRTCAVAVPPRVGQRFRCLKPSGVGGSNSTQWKMHVSIRRRPFY